MQKILVAFDATYSDRNALQTTAYFAQLSGSKITGIFLENEPAEQHAVIKQKYGIDYVDFEVDEESFAHKTKMEMVERNISIFKKRCLEKDISYNLHRDTGVPEDELIEESRFADVMIVDAETSFGDFYEGSPTPFIKDVITKAQCPVIIAPETFTEVNDLVFAYDGSPSSLFAIKQFTYLFPQLANRHPVIVTVNKKGKWDEDEQNKLKEWLGAHYTNHSFEALEGDAEIRLFDYLLKKDKALLVIGAYGRSGLSQFFKRSHADLLLKTLIQPIFISHL